MEGIGNDYVYFDGIVLENRDSKSFEILNDYYTKDINNVYSLNHRLD